MSFLIMVFVWLEVLFIIAAIVVLTGMSISKKLAKRKQLQTMTVKRPYHYSPLIKL